MFDWILGPLECPDCGAVSEHGNIQTHLRGTSADGSGLAVGSVIDAVDLEDLGSNYLQLRQPTNRIRILETWSCCGDKWAMIEIVDRRIHEVSAVALDRLTLLAAHFINEVDAEILADTLRGDLDEALDPIAVLERRLPEIANLRSRG